MSARQRPLRYTFESTKGTLAAHGSTAMLATGAVAPGPVILKVVASDDRGASASVSLTVMVLPPPMQDHYAAARHAASPVESYAASKLAIPFAPPLAPMPAKPPVAAAPLAGGEAPPPHAPSPQPEMAAPPPPAPMAVPHPVPALQPAAAMAAPPPAAAPSPAPAAAPAPPDEDAQFLRWHETLPFGHIDDNIAIFPNMRLGVPYTVAVTIHGDQAALATPAPGVTEAKLQVSPHMEVDLTSGGSPDDFTIQPADTPQNPRFIAPDGATVWHWTVTPKSLGELKLNVAAFVLYGDTEQNRASYETYDRSVKVKSVTLWGYLTDGIQYVLENPGASLKYVLPGGGGAAILAGLIAWWQKRKSPAPK